MQLSNMVALVSQRLAEGQDGPTFYPAYEIVAALNEAQPVYAASDGESGSGIWARVGPGPGGTELRYARNLLLLLKSLSADVYAGARREAVVRVVPDLPGGVSGDGSAVVSVEAAR